MNVFGKKMKGVYVLSERLTQKAPKGENYFLKERIKKIDKYQRVFGEAAKKLAEYEDLEEQGRLIITPAAVGDMAYHVIEDNVVEPPVYISEHKIMDVSAKAVYFADDWWKLDEMAEMNAFLTKAEAEEKLRELEGK